MAAKKRGRPKKKNVSVQHQLPQLPPSEPNNQNPNPNAAADSPGSSGASFDQAAQRFTDTAAAAIAPAPDAVAVPSMGEQIIQRFVEGLCSDEQIRKYLPLPFNAIAVASKQECARLADWEIELWAPAVQACGVRYGPELLAQTDKPELMMLATAAVIYAARVSIQWKKAEKPPEQDLKSSAASATGGTEQGSTMAAFPASPGS